MTNLHCCLQQNKEEKLLLMAQSNSVFPALRFLQGPDRVDASGGSGGCLRPRCSVVLLEAVMELQLQQHPHISIADPESKYLLLGFAALLQESFKAAVVSL